jgi:hypothetical protein
MLNSKGRIISSSGECGRSREMHDRELEKRNCHTDEAFGKVDISRITRVETNFEPE